MIKLSDDFESVANEIKVLKTISKVNQEELDEPNDKTGFPDIISYGMLTCVNLNPKDIRNKKKLLEKKKGKKIVKNWCLFGYYIMPKYEMTLK